MLKKTDFITARNLLLDLVNPVEMEKIPLADCAGRILAETVVAAENVPPFNRSPYDGYAIRSEDTKTASREQPVTLNIIEEVPAGAVPSKICTNGSAVKILTGAPIPEGADAVVQFELTEFTEKQVKIFFPAEHNENVIPAGDDVQKGDTLAESGKQIDTGIAGTLAAQGISQPEVFRTPKIGIISTGNEVAEVGEVLLGGKIYNSNRFTLAAALQRIGCESIYIGRAGDSADEICGLLEKGIEQCDAVLLTGGVSVGDYDFTFEAMEKAGVNILIHGVVMKPGMACVYGERNGKIICGLSGNPASALTSYYVVVEPVLKKMAGLSYYIPTEIPVIMKSDFKKKSRVTRFLRGSLDLTSGRAEIILPKAQGNGVLSSTIGCNVMVAIPAGSGPVAAGTILKGFLL